MHIASGVGLSTVHETRCSGHAGLHTAARRQRAPARNTRRRCHGLTQSTRAWLAVRYSETARAESLTCSSTPLWLCPELCSTAARRCERDMTALDDIVLSCITACNTTAEPVTVPAGTLVGDRWNAPSFLTMQLQKMQHVTSSMMQQLPYATRFRVQVLHVCLARCFGEVASCLFFPEHHKAIRIAFP